MKRILILFGFLITVLIACGKKEQSEKMINEEIIEEQLVRSEYDWSNMEWKENFSSSSGNYTLYVTDCITDLQNTETLSSNNKPDFLFSILGSKLYILDIYTVLSQDESALHRYFLKIYDDSTGKILEQQITLPSFKEYADCEKKVMKFDVINDRQIVFFVQCWREGNTVAYLAAYFDLDGKFNHVADLYPAMKEFGISIPDQYGFENVYADEKACYAVHDPFLSDVQTGKILVLNEEGELITQIGSDIIGSNACFSMKAPDGTAIFEIYNKQDESIQLLGYDEIQGEILYANVQIPNNSIKAVTKDGYLFYGDSTGKLYRWDLYSGTRDFCIDYGELGISKNENTLKIMIGGDGEPILLDYLSERILLYRLGTEQESQQETINLVSFTNDCAYISNCALRYSQDQSECSIIVNQPNIRGMDYYERENELKIFRNRAMADLSAGKLADIYFVSAEDMRILYEDGALADLSEILNSEDKEMIYSGVLDCGVIDGKQIGLAPSAYVNAVMVRNDLWTEDHWNWEEAISLYQTHPELEYLIVNYPDKLNSQVDVLTEIFLTDLSSSPLLNLEEGWCDFNNPLFIQIMELVKKYDYLNIDAEEKINEDLTAAFRINQMDFVYFSNMMGAYGEKYHLVGFPTEGNTGNYWECEYFLVVNKNTLHMDQIKNFMTYVFSKESQSYDNPAFFPIRDDMIVEHILWTNEWDQNPDPERRAYYDYGDGSIGYLPIKSAGVSWINEYREMVVNAVPHNENVKYIEQIIREEAADYFSDNKDIQDTINLLQSRVQLYINEQK